MRPDATLDLSESTEKPPYFFGTKFVQAQLWTYQTLQNPPVLFLELEFQHVRYVRTS